MRQCKEQGLPKRPLDEGRRGAEGGARLTEKITHVTGVKADKSLA